MSQVPPPDVSRGAGINSVAWIGFAVTLLFVVVRVFSRVALLRQPGWDDAIIVFSTSLNLIFCALSSAAVSQGLGRHLFYVAPEAASKILYYAAILQPLGIAAYTLPKLAVAILLVHLMGPKKTGRWFLYGICVVLYISSALSAIFIFAQCDPPSHFWNPTQPAKCMSPLVLQRITLFAGSWSAFVDLCLAIFPITIFWDLQMPLRKKISISFLMGLGVLAMIAAIIKTSHLPEEQDPDFTYAFYDLLIWTFVETDVVIVCASLPFLPRVFTYIRQKEYRYGVKNTAYYNSKRRVDNAGGAKTSCGFGKAGYTAFGGSQIAISRTNESQELGHLPQAEDRGGIVKSVRIEQTHDFI